MQKPIRGSQLTKIHPFVRGLVGFWMFNEGMGDKANDLSANGNHGDISNATWGAGQSGVVLDFGGAGSVDTGKNVSELVTNDFTILIRAKITTDAVQSLYGANPSGGNRFYLTQQSSLSLRLGLSSWNPASFSYTLNKWIDYAVVLDGSTGRYYTDGILRGSSGVSRNFTHVDTLKIGSNQEGGSNFGGLMDYFVIYNRAFSLIDIHRFMYDSYVLVQRAHIPLQSPAVAAAAAQNLWWPRQPVNRHIR